MKAIILSAKTSIGRPSLRRGFLLMPLLLSCFGLAPMAQAVGPDTDGAIPGSNNGEGIGVLVSRTTGIWNTGTGFEALNHLTAGNQNTATGLRALSSDINGGYNTATGVLSLFSNTSGFFNSATGAYSLANNTVASFNTANGYGALYFNTEGDENTAIGFGALYKNTTGGANVAVGVEALNRNTEGVANNAVGRRALFQNTEGPFNNAHGNAALFSNTTGLGNDAFGDAALFSNVTGNSNTAIGDLVGLNITGSGNVCIGAGVFGVAGENNTTRIRNIYTTVQPIVGTDPDSVTVDSGGRLGRGNVSSRRYKHDIKPMDNTSEAILKLKPVSFRYNKEYDATQTLAFGLIAEDVAEVYPDLVGRNPEGQPESVRYEQINAMLLNEFLKAHRKMEEQEATITQLKSSASKQGAMIANQQKQIEALTTGLQKVSAQLAAASPSYGGLETTKPDSRVVANKP
jgi:uncharacterized coiled-coil protein SlyX